MNSPAPQTMEDQDFLTYVSGVSSSPRCAMTPDQLARLLSLAGHHEEARAWDGKTSAPFQANPEVVRTLVAEALALRMERQQDIAPSPVET